MIQINLVPDVKLELINAQRHRNLVVAIAVLVIAVSATVVVILALTVFVGQTLLLKNATDQIAAKDKEFRETPDIEKTVTIRNQIKSIDETHTKKVMTSRIFSLLTAASMKGTDNSVSVNSFDIDTSQKTISVVAQTDVKGFEAAEVFSKNIQGMKMYYVEADDSKVPNEFSQSPKTKADDEQSVNIASDVSLSDLSYSQGDSTNKRTVSFKVTFTYDEKLFDEKIDLLRISGLAGGNVTDSYTRLPQSLFTTTDVGVTDDKGNKK